MARRVALLGVLACALAAGALGCGGEEGVAEDATVTAYVEAPLCAGAKNQVGSTSNSVEVRFVCLADPRGGNGVELATVGANARRATEDSTSVAFLETPDPAVNRFTHPILEEAGIGWFTAPTRQAATLPLLEAVAEADRGSLREDVRQSSDAG
jgi:hypothetical protein